MVKIKIAIPCKDDASHILLTNNVRTMGDIEKLKEQEIADVSIETQPNNTETLTQFGNKHLDKAKEENVDYLIFMHADVDLSLEDFVSKLLKNSDKYNVVGLAGTKKLFISQSPLTWFTGSHKYPNERYGRITHNHDGIMIESFFNKEKAEVEDTEVVTIDGLLMCFDKKTIENDKARFDEQFTYDFYDLDFCLNVQLNTDLKIGVLVIPTIHQSLGKSVLSEQFLIPERKFRAKYATFIKN